MLYGATTIKSVSLSGRVSRLQLVHEPPRMALISCATRSASSCEEATLPMCSTARRRSPEPNVVFRSSISGGPDQPVVVRDLGDEPADVRMQAPPAVERYAAPSLARYATCATLSGYA